MKFFATILVFFTVLLCITQATENNNKSWNLCKGQKIHNAPFHCRQPECSQLCRNLHPNIRGFGSCRNELCQCFFFCPADRFLRRDFLKAEKKSRMPSSSSRHVMKKP
ncbi:hypothetical protein TIFTF001_004229 [Ficus carica]|uniref:Defensin-like protein n=1 Tax=Ficus carica TaxID=3494 RepID=A0AA88A3Q0_FICCA|nr:hypothetical protein TIFTF001_004229 [Ficus carica]